MDQELGIMSPSRMLLKTNSSCYLFYNEEGYSKETLFATGYYFVKEIKEAVAYEDEKTIFEQADE